MQTETPPRSFWQRLLAGLFPVPLGTTDLSKIRRVQLLLAFSLTIGIVCSLGASSAWLARGEIYLIPATIFGVGLLSLLAYVFARTRHYMVGAWLLVTMMAVAGYALFFFSDANTPSINLFIMLPMALVLSAGLLSLREQIFFLAINVLLVMLLPLFAPGRSSMHYAGIFLSLGLLLVIISAFRNRLERDQLNELSRANTELRTMHANLENLVKSRTAAANEAQAKASSMVQALEEQIWLSNGQVTLSTALRDEKNLHSLAASAMRALCEHLNAPVAAFFLLDNERLEYLAGYAHLPAENAPRNFQIGEGLVGQVALDRQRVIINRVGPEHLQVASGLGNALPNQIVILPCVSNRQLIGVLEIGLLDELPLPHLNFLEQAAETLAVALQAAKARQRIDELLAETQAQSEELQAREEELRAANEELQVQAENMRGDANRKKA